MEPRRQFRFLKELAAGGFGKVYLAEMVTGDNFSSVVAIKLLHGKWLGNDEIVMRSRDEARLLGRLRHRSIVRVEDLTSINGQCAIVMEYLHGADLKTACAWLKERGRPFPRRAAFEVIAAVADALDAAYNARPLQGGEPLRVIHRDIKPSNVMITVEGDVKVLDFGTARASFEEREAKTQALAFGSAAYMAPERHMGEDDTVSADVFSLGVTAYEVLSLDGYGKIQVRPERYEAQIAERLGALDFGGLSAGVRADALELLRSMLAYEMGARPTAAEVRERAEALAESTRDLPLRRFAREHVALVADSTASPLDPADNLAGAVVHEDSSGDTGGANDTASIRTWDEPPSDEDAELTHPGGSAPLPAQRSSPSIPRPPPAPVGLATVRPSEAPRARPVPSAAPVASTPTARARPSNISLGAAPTIVGFDEPATPVAPVVPLRPPPGAKPPPPSLPLDDAESLVEPRRAPTREAAPTSAAPVPRAEPAVDPFEAPAPAPSGGLWWKLLLAGVALLVLAGSGGLAAWAWYHRDAADPTPPTPPIAPVADAPARALPDGADMMDWSPNADGKGGAILTVPAGAVEVAVTNSADYRTEWNGQKFLRLRDLAPGVYRTKVKPTASAPAERGDFTVEAGRTCVLAFQLTGGEGRWEVGECR